MTLPNNGAVVVDANILIAICAKETGTHLTAENAFKTYAANGREFFAPSVIVAEGLFALCQKFTAGVLTQAGYEQAIEFFTDYMTFIATPGDEASLMKRAVEIRAGYGCSRSSDGLYIALAEVLALTHTTEIMTFDKGFTNQAAKNAPAVNINLLIA